uniref:type II toxin-antitoxin system RelE/ParE family toxin n=1 Tax=Neorhizobium sp. EC2-8 TaxID=3129230 RepID=UPI00310138D8
MKRYEIEVYETEDGNAPFNEWLDDIKSAEAKTQVVARIRRASLGNFGDWKSLTGAAGICEMRIHHGQGFRVFYTVVGQTIVLLLAGSTKKEQDKTIAKAKTYLEDYNRRVR